MLPDEHRLKNNLDFKRVYSRNSGMAVGPIVLYSLKTQARTRIGFSVSKKLGCAVKRNRIRRLLREAAKLLLIELVEGYDIVIVARRSASGLLLPDFCRALQEAGRRKGILAE